MSKIKAPLWGECESVFSTVSLSKEEIKSYKMITDDLDFKAQNFTKEGDHPVIFMLNTQKIHIFFKWFTVRYHEMIPLLPYIKFKKDPEDTPYQCSPILYVDNLGIIIGARILWHLNKVWARFVLNKPISKVNEGGKYTSLVYSKSLFSKKKAVQAEVTLIGSEGEIENFPNLVNLSKLFLTNALIYNFNSPPEYWVANYIVKMKSAQGAESTVETFGIKRFPNKKFKIPSITENVLGAFKLKFDWYLHKPTKVSSPGSKK